MTSPAALVQKRWSYCNILRDDGLSYGDYVEQLAFLLFLKMADEQSPLISSAPAACASPSCRKSSAVNWHSSK